MKCESFTPGIDTAVFKPQDKSLCRRHLDLPADAFCLIITGGASLNDAHKNVPWLFDQLSRLQGPRECNRFGIRRQYFCPGSRSRLSVRFIGGIRERRDLWRTALGRCRCFFVSASLMETHAGLTLVEAMGCGTPIVAFRVGVNS